MPAGRYAILVQALGEIEAKIAAAEAAATDHAAMDVLLCNCPLCMALDEADGEIYCEVCPAHDSSGDSPCDRAVDARRKGRNGLYVPLQEEEGLTIREVLIVWREALADTRARLEDQVAPS